jgi:ubiquinone/menaquinone biosynthesis C-methylase UbiE
LKRSHDVERFNRWAATYDRHRLQRIVFEPMLATVLDVAAAEVPKPGRILDVGCGTGRLLRSAHDRFGGAALFGVDAAAEMVKRAQASSESIDFQEATAEKLPFADQQFDLVFSTMTFHHWTDQGKGIAEIARVMRPGGRWLLADFMPAGFVRWIRRLFRMHQFPVREELNASLSAAGLEVVGQHAVPGLRGQVVVLAIGAAA